MVVVTAIVAPGIIDSTHWGFTSDGELICLYLFDTVIARKTYRVGKIEDPYIGKINDADVYYIISEDHEIITDPNDEKVKIALMVARLGKI